MLFLQMKKKNKVLYHVTPAQLRQSIEDVFYKQQQEVKEREFKLYVSFPNEESAIKWFREYDLPLPEGLYETKV